MNSLIRLVYASRSAIESSAQQQGLDPGVARILAKSRRNNARRQIAGGLLFGEGYFLQCLEGEAEVVQALYATIAADPRHRDVTVLAKTIIPARTFGAWSMKYVPGEQRLQALLQQWGLERFDPYRLSAAQIEVAVQFMQREIDAAQHLPQDAPSGASGPARPPKQPAVAQRLLVGAAGPLPARRHSKVTLGPPVVRLLLAGVGVACAAVVYLLYR